MLSTTVFNFSRITFRLSKVPWLSFTTSCRLGVSSVFSSSPSRNSGPVAVWLLMFTTVSPSTPTVVSAAIESLCRLLWYLLSSFITTCTGVSLRSVVVTTVIVFTVPIVTPSRFTAAPAFSPAEFSKYVVTVSLREKNPSPEALVIRNSRVVRITTDTSTITPIFN